MIDYRMTRVVDGEGPRAGVRRPTVRHRLVGVGRAIDVSSASDDMWTDRRQDVSFTSGDATLTGTLVVPSGVGPFPAVVMLQGSGSTDRDNGGYFLPIREHFLRHRLAVL